MNGGNTSNTATGNTTNGRNGTTPPVPGNGGPAVPPNHGGLYLSFAVGNEIFAVPIWSVREVLIDLAVAAKPHMNPGDDGFVNLRGEDLPLKYLAARLGIVTTAAPAKIACGLLVQSGDQAMRLRAVLAVDRMLGVIDVRPERIEAPSAAAGVPQNSARARYAVGIVRTGNQLTTLLNVQALLA